jgi:hypothetical protein
LEAGSTRTNAAGQSTNTLASRTEAEPISNFDRQGESMIVGIDVHKRSHTAALIRPQLSQDRCLGARPSWRRAREEDGFRGGRTRKERAMAGAIDPLGQRKNALDAFLETKVAEGFRIETHTDTHAIIIVGGHRKPLWSRFRKHGAGSRYVVSVDERGEVTMIPAEPKRN